MNEQAKLAAETSAELDDDLEEAHGQIQDAYPGLDWDSDVNPAVSDALKAGFQIGRDFANSYPD